MWDWIVAYCIPGFIYRPWTRLWRGYYSKSSRAHRRWIASVNVGDYVEDCRGLVLQVIHRDGDDVTLEDGARCSLSHCCEEP